MNSSRRRFDKIKTREIIPSFLRRDRLTLLAERMEELRRILNREVEKGDLNDGLILKISQELDDCIVEYYRMSVFKHKKAKSLGETGGEMHGKGKDH